MTSISALAGGAWKKKFSRTTYFLGAIVLHLVIFFLVATWVIFPAFIPPADEFTKTYLPPSAPPPPPPPVQVPSVQVPTQPTVSTSTPISTTSSIPSFTMPMPDIVSANAAPTVQEKMAPKALPKTNTISDIRLTSIMSTEQKNWNRDKTNILEAHGDPKNVVATFPVYLASYSDGDWGCNVSLNKNGAIVAGSLPDLVAKMTEWSKGNLKGTVVPTPLNIGGPELMDKKPPFIFFTGHKDFKLTDLEIKNLQDYLQVGGAIWGDNALAGRGSRFDVAFRREMKRVVPDLDKNFETVPQTDPIFTKSWFPITQMPEGMNYYREPLEHLDIDGKLAILYSPNDYSDMFFMRILPGDTVNLGPWPDLKSGSPLFTNGMLLWNSNVFFRNFNLPSCLSCQQLGMNIIGYMLVRFDNDLLLSP